MVHAIYEYRETQRSNRELRSFKIYEGLVELEVEELIVVNELK